MVQRFAVGVVAGSLTWLAAAGQAHAQACPTPGTVSTACSGNCAVIAPATVPGARNNTVQIPISFTQGPNDGQNGKGFDEVSAIAFTLSLSGSGDTTPLSVDCSNGNLAAGVVSGVPNNFTAVVENAQCAGRTHCLCPDTGAGQTRDNYANIVVYGPSSLPEQGPVQIPVLPANGQLLILTARIAPDAPDTVPLHIFSALDSSKPQFAANLSIGDQAACDVTANAQNRSNVTFTDGVVNVGPEVTPTVGPTGCIGDCNGDGEVRVNELVIGVNIALGAAQISSCPAFDKNGDGMVTVNELVLGVNNALNACPA